jgi:tRNA C32,U32 (ribose-2'-O)-methylase TrmJ
MKSIKKFLQASLVFAAVFGATQSSAMYSTQAQMEQRQRTINQLLTKKQNIMDDLSTTKDKNERSLLMKKLNIVNDQLEINQKELAGLKGYL